MMKFLSTFLSMMVRANLQQITPANYPELITRIDRTYAIAYHAGLY